MALIKRGKGYGVKVYRNGRQEWIGTYRTRDEARDAEAQAILDGRSGSSSMPVADFAKTWLRHYPRPKQSTEIHYEESIKGFVSEFGKLRLKDLSTGKLRGWAAAHRGQAMVARTMLSDATRDGLIVENPLTGLKLPQSRGRKDLVPPSETEVERLSEIAVAKHGLYGERMYAPMIRFAAATGLRPGELRALRWQDVSVDQGLAVVTRQWSHTSRQFTSPKNGRPRNVELIPAAVEALRVVERDVAPEDLVFVTPTDRMFSGPSANYYYWKPVRVEFGRPDMAFYELRHAFGTMLARNGVGAPAIARMMGHVDGGKLALERYIHLAAQDARDEVRRAFATQ